MGIQRKTCCLKLVLEGRVQSNIKDSSTGHRGISWNKKRQKWQARIQIDGKRKELGFFTNINDAIIRRKQYEVHTKQT